MILRDSKPVKWLPRASRWLPVLLLLLLLGFMLRIDSQQGKSVSHPSYFCDAEERQGDFFVGQGSLFRGGASQSDEVAYSGRYASKITPGWKLQFGFSLRLKDLPPGAFYQADVWHYANHLDKGKLVVQGVGKGAFYQTADYPVERTKDYWERFQLTFQVPEDSLDYIHIYVVNNGRNISYFDDLSVQPVILDADAARAPKVQLELTDSDLAFFRNQRADALRQGLIKDPQKSWRKGHFRQVGSDLPIPARIRLKGDLLDHLIEEKWSFRVELDPSQNWRQQQVFSLQTPAARYYLSEWLLHKFWGFHGVLTPDYDFAELLLNEKSLGLYALEEHFEIQLLETQERRAGPIVRFDETAFWDGVERQLQLNHSDYSGSHQLHRTMQSAEIDHFSSTAADSTLLREAYILLRQFQTGKRPARDIFDLDRMARYYAACDIFQAYHGVAWHNQRYYFNPISHLLEPIGFDGCAYPAPTPLRILGQGGGGHLSPLFEQLYQDSLFAALYNQTLFELTEKRSLQAFLDHIRPDLIPRLLWMAEAFPEYRWKEQQFLERAQHIHAMLLPYAGNSLKAGQLSPGQLEVTNWHTFPLQIVGFGQTGDQPDQRLRHPILLPGAGPREIAQRLLGDSTAARIGQLSYRWLSERAMAEQFIAPREKVSCPKEARFVFYQTLGIDSVLSSPIQSESIKGLERLSTARQELLRQFPLQPKPYLSIHKKQVRFSSGRHVLHDLLVIPEGYELLMGPGTTLDLQGGGIICFGRLTWIGTEAAPIFIQSSTGNNQGISLLQSKADNRFQYVKMTGLQPLNWGAWQLSGAFTAWDSRLQLEHFALANTSGEDGANFVRCAVELVNCRFQEMPGDGLDLDYCRGRLLRCNFRSTGNDGLDVSGSLLELRECRFSDHKDKGISVGEQSDLALFDSRIDQCPIGLAVKDLSTAIVEELHLKNCSLGMAVFQKKGMFGGAHLIVKNLKTEAVRQLYLVDPDSSLELDGALVQ